MARRCKCALDGAPTFTEHPIFTGIVPAAGFFPCFSRDQCAVYQGLEKAGSLCGLWKPLRFPPNSPHHQLAKSFWGLFWYGFCLGPYAGKGVVCGDEDETVTLGRFKFFLPLQKTFGIGFTAKAIVQKSKNMKLPLTRWNFFRSYLLFILYSYQ